MDDTIQEKPHSDENELICWHYDHSTGQTVKGINILNMLYSSGDTKIPVAFELIEKPVVFYHIATQKQKRKSNTTKVVILTGFSSKSVFCLFLRKIA